MLEIFADVTRYYADPLRRFHQARAAPVLGGVDTGGTGSRVEFRRVQTTFSSSCPTDARFASRVVSWVLAEQWEEAEDGVSWLELLVAFETAVAAIPGRHEDIRQRLDVFRREACKAISLHLDREAREAFVSAHPVARLVSLGFRSPVACLKIIPIWPADVWARISSQLLALRPGITPGDIAQWERGGLSLPRVALNLRQQPSWQPRAELGESRGPTTPG
eukprot:14175688-Alexandrium_andersonii.AAC.1